MIDNEIIKALECCIATSGKGCSECPYHKYFEECRTKRNNDCIDLINRQKAEIERLQKLNDEIIDKLKCMTEENHELACDKYENEIRVIKEFAVKLCEGRVSNDPVVIAVKTELKEAAGDE